MDPTIAVAHYPEGAGHATRMLAVANALEAGGASVRMAGGGAGTEFVALNGYDAFEPTAVDYIDTYQGGSLWRAARRSLPASLGRIADYQAWLSATDPDGLVTDDMFAAMAATRCDVPLYVLKHDMPGLYDDPVERTGARFHTLFQLSAAREFFYPVVWPESGADPDGATRIPPVALEGSGVRDAADVVVVPSHYSSLSRIAGHLRRQGYDVLDVADDDWDPVPSLLPYLRGADVVVCSGYSTVMDAAVAGTPCVVHPATDEQAAVAGWLERFDVSGFAVAEEPIGVLDAVADPPGAPDFGNGAAFVAEAVLTDLRDPDPYAASAEPDESAGADVGGASGVRSVVAVPTLAAVCATTGASAVAPARLGRGVGRRAVGLVGTVHTCGRRVGRAVAGWGRCGADAATAAVGTAADACRAALDRSRRAASAGVGAGRATGRGLAERCRTLAPAPPLRP